MFKFSFISSLGLIGAAGIVQAAPLAESDAQVERGKQVYTQRCAVCHGRTLKGASAPALSGKDLLRPFNGKAATAAELEAWNRQTMPANDPGTLSRQESLAVIAYILRADGQLKSSKPLTTQTAAQIRLRR